ncbi:MAG: UvrD-helicase domain-containing protein [Clostridia bacterium]|nr:UvrD-helicase domain-containing protein [Clostridia bacterium]
MSESTNLGTRYIAAMRALFDKKFGKLNEMQRKAVFTVKGPLLVLAGAGTGKTTLLVNRISYILRYGNAYMEPNVPVSLTEQAVKELEEAVKTAEGADLDMILESFVTYRCRPWNILAITFTNKAANEMKTRLTDMLGDDVRDIWCGTFHAMCLRILRANIARIGWTSDFTIYDTDDSKKLMLECLKQLNIDEKTLPPKVVLESIGRAKDKLITPEEFDNDVGNDYRLQQISSLYTLYQSKLSSAMALDFDDIIMKTVALLRDNADLLDKYRAMFKYILVDEFQDTNYAQFELVRLLGTESGNVMVVGDDDQSIYKFRGATIENILHFDEKFKGTTVIKLEENYRSTSNILGAANSVIRHNFGRRGKELWTHAGEGEKIFFKHVDNYMDEGRFIINKIVELYLSEKRRYSDFAVLYRTNAQSNAIENALTRSGMPYRILSGTRFYDRKEIKDVLAYLCVINNPGDNLRLRRIINEPKRKIGESTMAAVELLADNEGKDMFYIMEHASEFVALSKAAGKFAPFVEMIRQLQKIAKTEKLSVLVEKTIELSGYRDMLLEAELDGEPTDRRENVEEFVSNAVEYENSVENATLSSFLEEISLVADIDEYDENADAVVLMTIHSAKGLEFPVVFIPGMEDGLFPSQQSAFSPDELEEERRLAYVAITRAKERLFLIGARERLMYGRTQYNVRSRFVDEIDPAFIASDVPRPKQRPRLNLSEKKKIRISNELFSRSSVSENVGKSTKIESFATGDRVRHITFGSGTVLSVREMGADILYEIAFDTVGTKKLMATYAKLKKE